MTEQRVKRLRRSKWLAAAWVLTTTLFAAAALWAPRPVRPQRLPILRLDARQLDIAAARDATLARKAPQGRWPRELRAVYAELSYGSQQGPQAASYLKRRYRRLEQLTRSVREGHGMEGLWAIRAEVTATFEQALNRELPDRRQQEILGTFPTQLTRYGVRDADGRWRAPRGVARAMFKARWNVMHRLEATQGFAQVEVQAYEGWLTLHAEGAPAELRLRAATRFAAAKGHRSHEAVAVWAARLGRRKQAAQALTNGRKDNRAVHLRNYALWLGP